MLKGKRHVETEAQLSWRRGLKTQPLEEIIKRTRGHNLRLTWELDPGTRRLLTPFPALGKCTLLAFPTLGLPQGRGLKTVTCGGRLMAQ